jgi:hypothetical protein
MFTFKSPAIPKNIWKLCFRNEKEMNDIFYEGKQPEDDARIHGITEYITSTIYIDKQLDGFLLGKALRHELMHIYLWETGQQGRDYTEEEVCDLMSVAGPLVNRCADEIMLRLREGLYKHGE